MRRISIKHLLIIGLTVSALLIFAGPASAEIEQLQDAELPDHVGSFEEWRFQEDVTKLPDFPDFDKLKKIQIDASQGRLKYYIDPASLKIGRDDVALVTIVITSERGARNVLFEGYRCDSNEYKTYAYGTSDNTFYELLDPRWKRVLRSKGNAQDFRRELLTVYICDVNRYTQSREDILRLIDYPQFRDDDGRMF